MYKDPCYVMAVEIIVWEYHGSSTSVSSSTSMSSLNFPTEHATNQSQINALYYTYEKSTYKINRRILHDSYIYRILPVVLCSKMFL